MFEDKLNPHLSVTPPLKQKKIYSIGSLCCDFTIFAELLSHYMLEEVMRVRRLQ